MDGEGADEKQPVSRKAVERTNAVVSEGDPVLRALAYPTGFLRDRVDFTNDKREWRGGMVNAKFGGSATGAVNWSRQAS